MRMWYVLPSGDRAEPEGPTLWVLLAVNLFQRSDANIERIPQDTRFRPRQRHAGKVWSDVLGHVLRCAVGTFAIGLAIGEGGVRFRQGQLYGHADEVHLQAD